MQICQLLMVLILKVREEKAYNGDLHLHIMHAVKHSSLIHIVMMRLYIHIEFCHRAIWYNPIFLILLFLTPGLVLNAWPCL